MMFVIWGKKAVYRKLGYVADFCTICRDSRVFSLRRIGIAGHMYYIAVGEGELMGFDRTCEVCNTSFPADPNVYQNLAKKSGPVASLVYETFPNLVEVRAERISVEEKVKFGPGQFAREDRAMLIRDPFLSLSPKVEARYGATHIDKEVGITILGSICAMTAATYLAHSLDRSYEDLVFFTLFALGAIAVLWQMFLVGPRFLRREVIPPLGLALKPLRPTEEEIQSALADLEKHGHKMGKKLKTHEVMNYLRPFE